MKTMTNFQEILEHFPPATQNNSRAIVRDLLERYVKKPSFGLEKRLEKFGIGVIKTDEYGDDYTRSEGFCLLDQAEWNPSNKWPSDKELQLITQ